MIILGIDIGGTNFRIGAVNEKNELVKFEKVPVGTVFYSGDILSDLTSKIKSFGEDLDYTAVAIGFPATLNADRSRVVQAPNIPFMENLPVCSVLREALGVPVYAERDVTYALCFDSNKYKIPNQGMTCGIYFGTGIGNAISINGIPLIGAHGTAGEIGHIPVAHSEAVCGCGNIGCSEAVAGGKALAKLQREKYPDTSIGDMFACHSEDAELRDFVDMMAIVVATEVNILDPDYMILGGGVFAMKGFPMDYLTERIEARVRKPLPLEELNLIYAEDEPDKSVVGAAIYARSKMK